MSAADERRQVFHFSRVWGSRHGGSYYSRALLDELIQMGWRVTVLAEDFCDRVVAPASGREHGELDHVDPRPAAETARRQAACRRMGPAGASPIRPGVWETCAAGTAGGPGLDACQAEERVILPAFFKRGLSVLPRKMADFRKVWKLITTAPEPLVIVQGDLPRVFYLMLQLRAPLLFIRQDGILSCPGNNRFLRRSRSVCRARLGVSCLSVHRKEECLGGLSLTQQLGRMALRMRDRLLLNCIRNFVGSSRYIARLHGRPHRALYPPRLVGTGELMAIRRNLHRLAFCGRLEEVKGAGDAVGILSLLPDQYHLEILGDGPERGRLGKLVTDLQLGSRVRFLGWVDPVTRDQVLASAGVLLMPSLWDEAFGMAGVEALAQGTPVVAYDVGGISEWCRDGAGVLVACGDIRRAAAAVRGLTDDPERWASCSEAAKRASALWFPRSRFGSDLEDLLREVLGTASEPEESKIEG